MGYKMDWLGRVLVVGYVVYVIGYWLIMEDYPPYWWVWMLVISFIYAIKK